MQAQDREPTRPAISHLVCIRILIPSYPMLQVPARDATPDLPLGESMFSEIKQRMPGRS